MSGTGPSEAEVVAAMFASDAASKAMGMEVVTAGDGHAVVTMVVRPDMVNGLDVCHGGFIFTLADSAMAFASNAANVRSFAVGADIDWLDPARLGAVLTATATTIRRRGRSAVHDVSVVDDEGTTIAVFRGRTRSVGQPYLS